VSAWSAESTWGGEFAPLDGETVYVPSGFNLLVDIDKSPKLNLVVVEGSLIFAPDADPTHERYFDAHYIYINKGSMEVGTAEHPYTSKVTITMHSNLYDPFLPIYGNKVIGVRYGTLDMHGPERTPTWTTLDTTAPAGSSTITLREAVDWVAGEQIGIASTDFAARHAEKRTITAVDNSNPNKPVLTLNRPLSWKKFAATELYGSQTMDMRAEVGLLSRNVVFRGDPETSKANQYGANIFMHSSGDDSVIGRFSNIELTDVGQAFKVGRYAIHFHMIGAVHQSYAKGVAVHDGFNRAFTIHGTHYLRLTDNVVYNVMGHNFFIEDAIETHNRIERNLVMMTKRSWSLLNTDQTPASFWITHPNNMFIDNHAAGSDRYGYWYDLQTHAIGPSANVNVCPENTKVGEFRNNHAHSNGRYGLRIFHNMVPRKFPCKAITFDNSVPTDPYWKNPLETMTFNGLTSWKNNRNGAIGGLLGDVRFENFKTADNKLAGIEVEKIVGAIKEDRCMVVDSLIVGRSSNTEAGIDGASPHGIISPRNNHYFLIKDTKFFNYDFNAAAALGDCSHCFHAAATDSGSRQTKTQGLQFTNVGKRIRYNFPHNGIYEDLDGTLTGKGAGSWASVYMPHMDQPECEVDLELMGGVTCDSTVQVRRLVFHGASSKSDMPLLRIVKWDDYILDAQSNITEYRENIDNYSQVSRRGPTNPVNHFTMPWVTGHTYHVHFGPGLNWEGLSLEISEHYLDTDKDILFVSNFSDVRQAIQVKVDGVLFENDTIPTDGFSQVMTGHNIVYNDSDIWDEMELKYYVTGFGASSRPYSTRNIRFQGVRCLSACNEQLDEGVEQETGTRYWSDPTNWPDETLPGEDDEVHILPGWNMIMDLEETPVYGLVRVNGKLTFKNDIDIKFRAKHIFVRAGELHIGSEETPYLKNCEITLYGLRNEKAIVYDNAIEAGNKLIANINKVRMYGQNRAKMTRLVREAKAGDEVIYVEKDLDWKAGDRIALAPTSFDPHAVDDRFVLLYSPVTGLVQLDKPLDNYHWGQAEPTIAYYGVDLRGEVALLSRNIKIQGEDVESWGCQIVTSDTVEVYGSDIIFRKGSTILDSVEIYNCSQYETHKTALRFENAKMGNSKITNCALHNGWSWGISVDFSDNIILKDNVLFNF